MDKLSFLHPQFLLLLAVLPLLAFWLYKNRKQQTATVNMSSTQGLAATATWITR
ncbi:MAG: BatA domain-containing protein, partial [Flavobacterium stagni]